MKKIVYAYTWRVQMNSVDKFKKLLGEDRFKGWQMQGDPKMGNKIPFFGHTIEYQLSTGNGIETYTSIIRSFGWSVCFGIVNPEDMPEEYNAKEKHVITLCQWKPGVNEASWELPPGGIGKLDSKATIAEITSTTRDVFLKETGFGHGKFEYLDYIMIETGKYRGASIDDHGLKAHMFMATGIKRIQYARRPNPNEILETIFVPLSEFRSVLESGSFVEESAVVCAYKSLIKLGRLSWSK